MFTFRAEQWVPQFILNDKNGYALAKAIEAAVQYMNDKVQQGFDCLTNFDKMPEWRLDELAWETNCLYDYSADVETKRRWIKNAIPLYRLYGTPQAVYQYIGSYFDDIDLEENWIYDGDPFHFRVTVDGEWTPENEAWARRAIATAKNVRSVLDSLRIGQKCLIGIAAEGKVYARFAYPLTGAENWAGRWPLEAILGRIDETGAAAVEAEARGQSFPYPMAGTRPEINTLGVLDIAMTGAEGHAEGHRFPYPVTSGEQRAGTRPEINTRGAILDAQAGAQGETTPYRFPYPVTGEERRAGTTPQTNTLGVLDTNGIEAAQPEDSFARITYKLCGEDEI